MDDTTRTEVVTVELILGGWSADETEELIRLDVTPSGASVVRRVFPDPGVYFRLRGYASHLEALEVGSSGWDDEEYLELRELGFSHDQVRGMVARVGAGDLWKWCSALANRNTTVEQCEQVIGAGYDLYGYGEVRRCRFVGHDEALTVLAIGWSPDWYATLRNYFSPAEVRDVFVHEVDAQEYLDRRVQKWSHEEAITALSGSVPGR